MDKGNERVTKDSIQTLNRDGKNVKILKLFVIINENYIRYTYITYEFVKKQIKKIVQKSCVLCRSPFKLLWLRLFLQRNSL